MKRRNDLQALLCNDHMQAPPTPMGDDMDSEKIEKLKRLRAKFEFFQGLYAATGYKPLWAERMFWQWVKEVYGD